jgi:hypothetical protein
LPGGSAQLDLEQRGVVAASNPSSKPQTQKIEPQIDASTASDAIAAPRFASKITPQAINYRILDE